MPPQGVCCRYRPEEPRFDATLHPWRDASVPSASRALAYRSTPFAQASLKPRDLPRAEILGMALQQCEDRRMRLAGAALQLLRRGALDRLPL
ncbi:hypothetical protein [Xanthomonas graminis]|nr:hypothetical protein [Xanthomonas translucens]UKE67461.1 hypothetical protein KM547_09750 [Xanthomonas translucens pv. phlei]